MNSGCYIQNEVCLRFPFLANAVYWALCRLGVYLAGYIYSSLECFSCRCVFAGDHGPSPGTYYL